MEQDVLKSIFDRMPEEKLPSSFQSVVMQRIEKEAVRISKRNGRLRLLALISASGTVVGVVVAALIYLDIPSIGIEIPPVSFPPFYPIFGLLALVLLVADHLLRRLYKNKYR
jgi:hypothetical protein